MCVIDFKDLNLYILQNYEFWKYGTDFDHETIVCIDEGIK